MMYPAYGYQSPQATPYPNMGYNNGGYPYGYPPQMPQQFGYGAMQQPQQPNPFQSPFPQPAPFIPGVTAPMEITNSNGNTMTISAQGFNQGGARVSQGGFNPVTGTVSPAIGGQGANPNPYNQFIGNPGYTVQQPQGFNPYSPPQIPNYGVGGLGSAASFFNPAYGGIAPSPYMIGQNQFNYQWQQFLYNEEVSPIDVRDMIEKAILTDEERDKIYRNRSSGVIIGYDYYNRPIYNNANYAYEQSKRNQELLEEARLEYQKHFTMLSRIAHAYTGEEFDEEAMMKRFDPIPQSQSFTTDPYRILVKNENDKKNLDMYYQGMALEMYTIPQQDQRMAFLENQKQAMFAQIKASHDRMLGVEPGEHYDLKTFMDNGYKIGINIAMQKSKDAIRNGTSKYSRNGFRASISQTVNSPIPITSKDDGYVSIGSMLTDIYGSGKTRMTDSILMRDGKTSFTTEPVFSSKFQEHQFFLQEVQRMKDKDDTMQAVNYK